MAKGAVREKREKLNVDVEVQLDVCQHHWAIETPAGSTSRGRCRRCGEERDFRNSAQDYIWEKDGGGGSPWRGTRTVNKTTSDDSEQITVARGAAALN